MTIQTKTENLDLKISTHTLTWSVTVTFDSVTDTNNISTHTLTWSVTEYWNYFYKYDAFQLTRSRGA